jgi:hypothetical protein
MGTFSEEKGFPGKTSLVINLDPGFNLATADATTV